MNVHKVIVVLVLILCYSSVIHGVERNAAGGLSGFGFEILLTKLDFLYDKIAELEAGMQKDREIAEKMNQTIHENLNAAVSVLSHTISQSSSTLQSQSNIAIRKVEENMVRKLDGVTGAIDQLSRRTDQNHVNLQHQLNVAVRKEREYTDLKLSNITGAIDRLSDMADQKLSKVIPQLSQTIDQKLSEAVDTLSYRISALKSSTAMEERLQSQLYSATTRIELLIERKFSAVSATIDKVRQTFVEKITTLQDEGNAALYKYILWANHEQMRKEIEKVDSKEDFARLRSQSGAHLRLISLKSCKDNPSKQAGKFILQSDTTENIFLGYCSNTRFGGGWLEIQYQSIGSVNFTRSWTDYRDGFGNYGGEQWIGLERLHRLTSARPYELYVYLKDFDGNSKYARYSEFEIGSETEQYALKKLGGYSGTAGDSLASHKGMKFSTWDRDNDLSASNCASLWMGGWWYNKCYDAKLNGVRRKGNDWENIVWRQYSSSNENMGLAVSRMFIRET